MEKLLIIDKRLAEFIKFNNGISGWYFSDKAHKVLYYCYVNNLDYNNYFIFDELYHSI